MGVGASLVIGLLLSPYLIRKLGPEAYGLWALSFALVEYCVFLDLGFRSATVKYVAHFWTTGESNRINEVLSTVLLYAGVVSALLFTAILVGSAYLNRFFQVPVVYVHQFRLLVILIALSWCLGFVFNNFGASLEAVQRFDLYNKTNVITTVLRASGTALLLYLGYGLVEIGMLVVCTQTIGYVLYFFNFQSIFPQLRLSRHVASLRTLRELSRFGIHTFVANVSTLLLNQSAPLFIGHFLPPASVGYYALPNRLLQYTGDAVGRAGIITNSNTAELQARGDTATLPQLAIFTNRYSVVLFMPLALLLWTYGAPIFRLWVPSIAQYSAPLLPILLTGYMIAIVGQFSSAMLLQGLGRHQHYARGLLAEAILSLCAFAWIIPRYGILGAAWVAASLMIMNRGIFTPWLVSREIGLSFWAYMRAIYGWPFATAIPVLGVGLAMRAFVFPGHSWLQIAAAAALVGLCYYGMALFLCVPSAHRLVLRRWVARALQPAGAQ
jgi:O-antigen/teichoic acid export membrane protein